MDRRADSQRLAEFAVQVLQAAGADHENAEATTWAMMHASLHGIDSHGIRLLPFYVDSLRSGLVVAKARMNISHPRRSAVKVDAGGGFGHLPTYRAMDEACALARETGIGMGVVVNSTHFGAAGAYALAAADAGFIGFVTCNSGAFVVPFEGQRPIHGTNPIALAAPAADSDGFLLDMATSCIPWNRVIRSRSEGLSLPQHAALDSTGNFTTDANAATMLGPVGGRDFGYKGAGLAGFAEILSAVLTGMRLSTEQDGTTMGDSHVGHFVMAIDPGVFVTPDHFRQRLSAYLGAFASQVGAMPAGGPQWQARRQRLSGGIPLPDGLYSELRKTAAETGVVFEF